MNSISLLEKKISKNETIVVDNTMQIQDIVNWTEAVTSVVSRHAYILLPRSGNLLVRSQNITLNWPLIIALNKNVHKVQHFISDTDIVSRKMILRRDNYTCQYCHSYGDTVDHIYPKCKGGKRTWLNSCCACFDCNNKKKNRTPEEAGMKTPHIKPFKSYGLGSPILWTNMYQKYVFNALKESVL